MADKWDDKWDIRCHSVIKLFQFSPSQWRGCGLNLFIFILFHACGSFVYIYLCIMYMHGAHKGLKGASDPLELKLEMCIISLQVSVGNWTQVLCRNICESSLVSLWFSFWKFLYILLLNKPVGSCGTDESKSNPSLNMTKSPEVKFSSIW